VISTEGALPPCGKRSGKRRGFGLTGMANKRDWVKIMHHFPARPTAEVKKARENPTETEMYLGPRVTENPETKREKRKRPYKTGNPRE